MKIEQLQKEAADILFKHHYPNMNAFLPRDADAIKELVAHVYTAAIEDAKGVMPGEHKFSKRPVHKDLADLSDMILEDAKKHGANLYRAEALNRLDGLLT